MKLRVLFALPGFHRVTRGAEIALETVADRLAGSGRCDVTLIGSGQPKVTRAYRFIHARCIARERFERWPALPLLRNEYMIEELTFALPLWRAYRPADFDVTLTCSYPYTNWVLRARRSRERRPAHVFVTQNGDWPAQRRNAEYRCFDCDGLICTNPEYHHRHADRWPCVTIPNGVDLTRFRPGAGDRAAFNLPDDRPIVLIVSALIAEKHVLEAIDAVARVPELFLVVVGDGPLREAVDHKAKLALPGRFRRLTVDATTMPDLYRAADVLLHMSLNEPFGNVFPEALACGLPIVAHDRPAARWMLEDRALLVDTRRPECVAHALRHAVTQRHIGVQQRRALAERRFDWDAIADAYAAFIERVHERRTAPFAQSTPNPVPFTAP